MSVYVDHVMVCVPNPNWKWNKSCHLFGDTVEELHAFAQGLGLKRAWFQHKPGSLPHYDLTENMRRLAVRNGALEVSREWVVGRMRAVRVCAQQGVDGLSYVGRLADASKPEMWDRTREWAACALSVIEQVEQSANRRKWENDDRDTGWSADVSKQVNFELLLCAEAKWNIACYMLTGKFSPRVDEMVAAIFLAQNTGPDGEAAPLSGQASGPASLTAAPIGGAA